MCPELLFYCETAVAAAMRHARGKGVFDLVAGCGYSFSQFRSSHSDSARVHASSFIRFPHGCLLHCIGFRRTSVEEEKEFDLVSYGYPGSAVKAFA